MIYASKQFQKKVKKEYKIIREAIIQQLGNKCWKCGSQKALSLHHILPIRYGGDNRVDNLMLLCLDKTAGNCHWKYNGKSYQWLKKNKERIERWSKNRIIKEMRKVLINGELQYKPKRIR